MGMTNHLFSTQDVTELLSLLRKAPAEYPPDLLTTRRGAYLSMVTQLTVTQDTINTRRGQWLSSILHEPASMIIKVLIVVFVLFLIAFTAHAIATGSLDLGWLMESLSR